MNEIIGIKDDTESETRITYHPLWLMINVAKATAFRFDALRKSTEGWQTNLRYNVRLWLL
jgi:hypothetical protein